MPEHKLGCAKKPSGSKGNENDGQGNWSMGIPSQEKDRTADFIERSNSNLGDGCSKAQSGFSSPLEGRLHNPLTTEEKLDKPASSKNRTPCQKDDIQCVPLDLCNVPGRLDCQQKALHLVWPHRW